MGRRCGVRGCIEDVLSGAFVEVHASVGDKVIDARIEVCLTHYEAWAPQEDESNPVKETK